MLVKGNICCKKSNCTKNIKRHTNISSATIHRNNIYGCFLLLTPRLAQKKKNENTNTTTLSGAWATSSTSFPSRKHHSQWMLTDRLPKALGNYFETHF